MKCGECGEDVQGIADAFASLKGKGLICTKCMLKEVTDMIDLCNHRLCVLERKL